MKVLTAISVLLLFSALSLPLQSTGWRGIVPLRTTRTDVERLLGPPVEKYNKFSALYRTSTETVIIQYAQGLPCGIGPKYSQWRVSRDTVESILVTPTQTVRFSDLSIDESKYDKRQGGHRREDVYYVNEEAGISFRVFMGEVRGMSYFPGTSDKDLKCLGSGSAPDIKCQGLAPPRFGFYGKVSTESEKSLLDNFGIALLDDKERMGYIIAYAGKRARPGEAKAHAEQAKKYLVTIRHFPVSRLKAIDGGYREKAEVDLYVVPNGNCPPSSTPNVDPRDVRIVRSGRLRSHSSRFLK